MLQRLEFHAMGCEMLAVVEYEDPSTSLTQVPRWFEEWEQVLSRFRYNSELTRLNLTHEKPVVVSETLWQVFDAARKAEKMTDGLVTPTLLDSLIEAGYDRPFDELPHQASSAPASVSTAPPSLEAIIVDDSARTLTLPLGMSLDFGGVAKGWAAHQAMQRLQAEGAALSESISPALLDAGGDIAVSGPRVDGSPWKIGVADPFHWDQEIEVLHLNRNGVATSGKNRRRWLCNGLLQHHIIDPLTSQPAETDLLTVTVIAPDVLQAEAAAKAAFILGSRAGLEWIESHPDLAGLLILDNGEMLYSARMQEYL
jgi:thiamine biosynthesis lipoprotein